MRQLTSLLVAMCLFAMMGCTQPVATKSMKTGPKPSTDTSKTEVSPTKPADKPAEKPADKPPEKPADKTPAKPK